MIPSKAKGHWWLPTAVLAVCAVTAWAPRAGTAYGATCAGGVVLNIVAHPDDDLIFLGATEAADIAAGACVRTVYLTTGNAGETASYWLKRETGTVAAHAVIAGTTSATTNSTMTVRSHSIAVRTLVDNPAVSMIFMRLPDGDIGGAGFPSTGNESLYKLWESTIPEISTVPDVAQDSLAAAATYSRSEFLATLQELITSFNPSQVRLQNYIDSNEDHADHLYGAKFAFEATQAFAAAANVNVSTLVTGFRGYDVKRYPQNLDGASLSLKTSAMKSYAPYDNHRLCEDRDCSGFGEDGFGGDWFGYPRWISREYRLGDPTNETGFFEIRGFNNKCIDVQNGFVQNETPIQVWGCVGVNHQKWKFDTSTGTITDFNSRKCMTRSAALVKLSKCVPGLATQRWTFRLDGELVNANGQCLDIPSATAADGTDLKVTRCIYSPRQLWGYGRPAFLQAPPHTITITGTTKCLNAEPASITAAGAVTIRPCNGSAAQMWRFTPRELVRGKDGKCLGLSNPAAITNGNALVLRPCDMLNLPDYQRWEPWNGPSAIRLHLMDGSGGIMCAGVRGGSTNTGTRVEISECLVGNAQEWVTAPGFPYPIG